MATAITVTSRNAKRQANEANQRSIQIRLQKRLNEVKAGTGLCRQEADDPTSGQEVRDRIFSSFQADSNPRPQPGLRLVQSDAGLSGFAWLSGDSGCSIHQRRCRS
jgi:hypothetical protein